jgi:hypothetical protein
MMDLNKARSLGIWGEGFYTYSLKVGGILCPYVSIQSLSFFRKRHSVISLFQEPYSWT